MDLHDLKKRLLWLNLASKLSLENMRLLRLLRPSDTLFFKFCLLVCLLLQSDCSHSQGPNELETPMHCSALCAAGHKNPSISQDTMCLDCQGLEQAGEEIQELPFSQSRVVQHFCLSTISFLFVWRVFQPADSSSMLQNPPLVSRIFQTLACQCEVPLSLISTCPAFFVCSFFKTWQSKQQSSNIS